MAQNGGYDLNDPFIDDDNLEKQAVCTYVNNLSWSIIQQIPEPPPYQVMRFISSEADSGNAPYTCLDSIYQIECPMPFLIPQNAVGLAN